jgi:hypothetical protein
MRAGMPDESEEDLADADRMASCWAGVLPVVASFGPPRQAPYSAAAGAALPAHLAAQVAAGAGLGAAPLPPPPGAAAEAAPAGEGGEGEGPVG